MTLAFSKQSCKQLFYDKKFIAYFFYFLGDALIFLGVFLDGIHLAYSSSAAC